MAGKRRFKVNDGYFSKLSKENCYWAGFIAADGTILKDRKLTIKLAITDLELLKRFKENIGSEHTIRVYPTVLGQDQCVITITSEQICKDLKRRFNIVPNKTFKVVPPNIKRVDLVDCFIKGYIDGDGCISKGNKYILHITGTEALLSWMNIRFSKILNREARSLSKRGISKIFQTRYEDKAFRKLFTHYYKVPFGLSRKWDDEILNYCLNWKRKGKENYEQYSVLGS